ncbi:MAG: formate dehydrogenase accessory protein FdhE [Myxococcota bacterium]|jgi:FdhE protein
MSRLEALLSDPRIPGEYVRFRIALLKAQIDAFDAYKPGSKEFVFPLVKGTVAWDVPVALKIIEAVIAALFGMGKADAAAAPLLEKIKGSPGLIVRLADASVFGPDIEEISTIARETGTDVESLLFFGRAIAAPFVARIAEQFNEAGNTDINEVTCPVCGSAPGIAFITGEDGNRKFTCAVCGTQWRGPRMKCVQCSSSTTLGFLKTGKDETAWVETCDDCKSYIKTVDARRLTDASALVESISTLYLDILAEQNGFTRALPYAAMR